MAGNSKQDSHQGNTQNTNTSNRGFTPMDEDKQRGNAKKSGESTQDEKRPFAKDKNVASEAGKKGGQNPSGGNR